MNWLYTYIENKQIVDPSISKTPYDVLYDLIYYGNHNYSKELNNLVIVPENDKPISYDDFYDYTYSESNKTLDEKINEYKQTIQHHSWIEYLTGVNLESNHLHRNILKRDIKEISKDEAKELAIKKDNTHYNSLIRIDNCWDKLLDYDFAFKTILENKMSPYFSINKYHFLGNKFDSNTNKELLEITKFLNEVYIDIMKYLLENKNKIVSPFNPINPSEKQINDMIENYNKSIKILEDNNTYLNSLVLTNDMGR